MDTERSEAVLSTDSPDDDEAKEAAFDALVPGFRNLIERVLIKHSAAVLEEMHDQIVARNDEIKKLQIALQIKTEEHNCCAEDLSIVRAELDALHGDKDQYCEILRVLGLEEEGDPIEEVLRLVKVESTKIADAERYRWLRSDARLGMWMVSQWLPHLGKYERVKEENIDDYIDSDMKR